MPVTDTLSVCLPHPPNAPNLEPSPSGSFVDKFRYRQRLPGSKNVVHQSYSERINDHEYATSNNHRTPLTYRTSNRSPLRTPCPVITRSRYSSPDEFPLRASIAIHLSCLIAMIALYLLFLPLFYCPVVSTTAAGAPVIDYVVDDRTPYSRATRQAEPLLLKCEISRRNPWGST